MSEAKGFWFLIQSSENQIFFFFLYVKQSVIQFFFPIYIFEYVYILFRLLRWIKILVLWCYYCVILRNEIMYIWARYISGYSAIFARCIKNLSWPNICDPIGWIILDCLTIIDNQRDVKITCRIKFVCSRYCLK